MLGHIIHINLAIHIFFYKLGWRGVNIDPNPHAISLFEKHRPDDVNLNFGIGPQNTSGVYYMIDEQSSMNSFSRQHLEKLGLMKKVSSEIEIPIYTLKDVLDKYGEGIGPVDFLNIDIEGMDYEVLISNDWVKYKPAVIAIEMDGETIDDILSNKAYHFLSNHDYKFVAKNYLLKNISTVFFIHKSMEV
jgi:FkbM family methyltransferase